MDGGLSLYVVYWILIALGAYYALAYLQFVHAFRIRKVKVEFPPVEDRVSVIIGLKSEHGVERTVRALMNQDHPDYEVVMVAEEEDDPGAVLVRKLTKEFTEGKLRLLISGLHDPSKCTGKNHNLLHGIANSSSDILLFGDSDIEYPGDWITRMTEPVGREHKGREVHAVTAPFLFKGTNFLGRFFTLSSNVATFLAAYAHSGQEFPPYSAGASLAVSRKVFENAGIAGYWRTNFNDDLIASHVLTDRGYTIYNRRDVVLRPEEDFNSLSKLNEKLVRWIVTVRTYQHPVMQRTIRSMMALNFQLPINTLLVILLLLTGFPLWLPITLLIFGHIHGVVFRAVIAHLTGEKLGWIVLLAPISFALWATYYWTGSLFLRKFTWGGHRYVVDQKFRP